MNRPYRFAPCKEPGCKALVGNGARGMCGPHYFQWKKVGGLLANPRPTMEQRFWSKVTKTDGCWEWTGSKKPNGYGTFGAEGRTKNAHRVAWEIANGPIPDGMLIDHICFNHGCVNPSHLRPVTQKQNQENRAGQRSDNTSGYRGVRLTNNKWQAEVYHNGKSVYIGRFLTREEANTAVTAARNSLFTHNDLDRINQKAAA